MSSYNHVVIDDVAIDQCITENGGYAVVFTKGQRVEVTQCRGPEHCNEIFCRNVKWYRGY